MLVIIIELDIKCGQRKFLKAGKNNNLSIDGVADFVRCAMPIHRFEAAVEHGALLDLAPIMEHVTILNRAGHLLLTTRDHLAFELLDCALQCFLGIVPGLHRLEQVCHIANTMIETLAAIYCYTGMSVRIS